MQKGKVLSLLGAVLSLALVLFIPDWKMDKDYFLEPGTWRGKMTYLGVQYNFELVIESARDGKLGGYMDWLGSVLRCRLAVRGTYVGNHLTFEEYQFIEEKPVVNAVSYTIPPSELAFVQGRMRYGFNDKKDVYVLGSEMKGTDKNGQADFWAVRVAPAVK